MKTKSKKKSQSIPTENITDDGQKENVDLSDDEEVDALVQSSIRLLRRPQQDILSTDEFIHLSKNIINTRLPSSVDIESAKTNGATYNLMKKQLESGVYDEHALLAPPLKRKKVKANPTSGKGWFDIEPLKMDDALQRDIKLIEMRNYIDPKRFYKKAEKIGQVLHIGTVVEGSHEYKSARLKNAERKLTIVDEMLADKNISGYSKKAFMEIQSEKMSKQKHSKKNKKIFSLYNKQKRKINKLF